MPWCPVCKNEYVEGKTHCPDCDVDLVEELTESPAEEEEIYIPTAEELEDLASRRAAAAHMTTYASAKSRHSDTRSSAWTFLIVGGVGFVIVTLAILGVIKLPLNTFSLAVMEVIFVIFLIVSAISFKNAGKMLDDISRENDLEKRIRAWAEENLTAAGLTAELEDDTTEEMKYFAVSEIIRDRLMHAFPEVDDAYAEELTETFYNELFS